jgi:hypothetical protein
MYTRPIWFEKVIMQSLLFGQMAIDHRSIHLNDYYRRKSTQPDLFTAII